MFVLEVVVSVMSCMRVWDEAVCFFIGGVMGRDIRADMSRIEAPPQAKCIWVMGISRELCVQLR